MLLQCVERMCTGASAEACGEWNSSADAKGAGMTVGRSVGSGKCAGSRSWEPSRAGRNAAGNPIESIEAHVENRSSQLSHLQIRPIQPRHCAKPTPLRLIGRGLETLILQRFRGGSPSGSKAQNLQVCRLVAESCKNTRAAQTHCSWFGVLEDGTEARGDRRGVGFGRSDHGPKPGKCWCLRAWLSARGPPGDPGCPPGRTVRRGLERVFVSLVQERRSRSRREGRGTSARDRGTRAPSRR